MTAVSASSRGDLDEVEDVALLVALAERFSFEPIRLDEVVSVRRARTSPKFRMVRGLLGAMGRGSRHVLIAVRRLRVPRVRLPQVRMPRRRVRYAVQPIILEGPRRVPIEVLHLSRPQAD